MAATLQSIFRSNFPFYQKTNRLTLDQHKAAQSIMACRSDELGHEVWGCENDDYEEHIHHSCRHRSCPRCQGSVSHEWLEKIKERLLPCDHYHVVFTLPHELNPIWHYNRAWSADRLFKSTSASLRELLKDERYLGGEVGMLSSLHTWGRTLSFHPHMHVLVTGVGLFGESFRRSQKDFLLPVGCLKKKFRGKWLDELNRGYEKGEIQLPPEWTELDWRRVLRQVARKQWNIRLQGAYAHGGGVAVYLSRYVRGGPLKDHRIVRSDEKGVCFRYRDSVDGKGKLMELGTACFLTRLMWHVPSKGQHYVRYYGLYAAGAWSKRERVREALGLGSEQEVSKGERKERRCPNCGLLLVYRGSVRRKISYIRSTEAKNVQQYVQADRERASQRQVVRTNDPPASFFGLCSGRLT